MKISLSATVTHSSIFDLIKSLYEGKHKAKYLTVHGEKEFIWKITKVFDKADIEKTVKFISKREKVKHISSKMAQMGKGPTRRRTPLNHQLNPASNPFQKTFPPVKAIKVIYLLELHSITLTGFQNFSGKLPSYIHSFNQSFTCIRIIR